MKDRFGYFIVMEHACRILKTAKSLINERILLTSWYKESGRITIKNVMMQQRMNETKCVRIMPMLCLAWTVLASQVASAEAVIDPMATLMKNNCAACHQLENKKGLPVVGPSLVEINHLYKNDPKGFVKWCISPGKKRKNAIQMPSMATVGEKNLAAIHGYIKQLTKGKKYKPEKVVKADPYALTGEQLTKPRILRIFLKDTSPASIAVTLNGQHSLCWDTVSCRLRYAWSGGFINGFPYWKGNGNNLAQVVGEVYYRAPEKVTSGIDLEGVEGKPRFMGYSVTAGLPTFRYAIGDVVITEAIGNDAGKLSIEVKVSNAKGAVKYALGDLSKGEFTHSKGKLVSEALHLTAAEALNFTMTFEPQKEQ